MRVRAAKESFLLLNPDVGRSSHEVAKAMAACRGVKRVFVTSGDFGFVVSTVEDGKHSTAEINKTLRRAAGRANAIAVKGHYVYAFKTRA